jgi:5'-nucleotidase
MHILLTNDDGVTAPGLLALKKSLESLGKVTVVAPSQNYSAGGHRKTMHKPLRIEETHLADGSPAWACSGAPSDCVGLALLGFIKEKVDIVVSGINPNANLGQDVTYSGTVTAAIEAAIAGVLGVAVSTENIRAPEEYEPVARVAASIVEKIYQHGLPANTLININVPKNHKGIYIARQGIRVYLDELVERRDPRNKPYYWIGGEPPTGVDDEGSDYWAMKQGYVSVTPLQLDMTAYNLVEALEEWLVK